MYAVIVDSGTQFFVEEGQKLLVDLRAGEPGQTLEFDRVLMVGGGEQGPKIGTPLLDGAKVVASIVGETRLKKIHVGTYKRRKNYRRHKGHRQRMTEIKISQLVAPV